MLPVTLPLVSVAFLAGVLSFISPCVLPLVPAYISYLGVRAGQQSPVRIADKQNDALSPNAPLNRMVLFLHGLMFVLGMTFVFVFFGLAVNTGLQLLGISTYDIQIWTARIGGVLVILFGLQVLGVWGRVITYLVKRTSSDNPFGKFLQRLQAILYADTRRQTKRDQHGSYVGSLLMGIFFAAGWTPCIGPIYGSILTFAVSVSPSQAVLPLIAYSFGIGLPFLLAAIGLDRLKPLLRVVQRRMRAVEMVSGLLMIFMGYLLVSGQMSEISRRLTGLASYQYRLEECTIGIAEGGITPTEHSLCMEKGLSQVKKIRECDLAISTGSIPPVDRDMCLDIGLKEVKKFREKLFGS